MNQTDGNTVNVSVVPTQNTTHGYRQQIVGLHPGYTTLISLGIAIFIIIVYIYYQDVQELLRRTCTRRGASAQTSHTKFAFTDNRGNGVTSTTAISMTEIQTTKKLLKEPAIRCECGQVHILKECLNKEELKHCKALFSHFRLEEEAKSGSTVEEIAVTSRNSEKRSNNPRGASDLRVDEGFSSNNELPHVVECDLSFAKTANTSKSSGEVSTTQNSMVNSESSPSRHEGSINYPKINENTTAIAFDEDTSTDHSNIQHEDASS